MATIITVHGTNASGPEEGERWWQKGSPFERRILELAESTDGPIRWEGLIWDGANSETSRRAASRRLLTRALELESRNEPYCMIGHSHGGSIIAHALMQAASWKRSLPGLKQWMTVGTPHISSRKSFLLFSRLGLIGKSAYVAAASFVLIALASYLAELGKPRYAFDAEHGIYFLPVVAPLIMLHLAFWFLNRRSLYMYDKASIERCNSTFGDRQVALWHSNDEAINGLAILKDLKFDIFPKTFAVPPLAFSSIFLAPAVLGYLSYVYTPDIFRELFLGRSEFITESGMVVLVSLALPVLTAVTFALSLTLLVLISWIASGVSDGLSRLFNRMTWAQIRAKAFGNDNSGEVSTDARSYPAWASSPSLPLPAGISDEITEMSNQAASQSLAKLRSAINTLAFVEGTEAKSGFIDEYLTWNELIHCCYFDSPKFQKLVAYAISQADGFRSTDYFRSDPEYEEVIRFFEQIRVK